MSSIDKWLVEEETYLRNLSGLCQELSGRYKNYYEIYKITQARFRIPSIVVSSITGLTSFGSSNFPPNYREWISISVGIASLSIAILNSIETYMKIGEHMAGASQASVELHKLKEYIDMELALPKENRLTQGIIFLRDCYTRYERILEIAPDILKTIRFIRPSYSENIDITKIKGPIYINDLENTIEPDIEKNKETPRVEKVIVPSILTYFTNGWICNLFTPKKDKS